MKNKAITYPLLILLVAAILYLLLPSSSNNDNTPDNYSSGKENKNTGNSFNFLPTSTTNQIIQHPYYTLSYSEQHEQAEWVAYELKKEHLTSTNRKRPLFEPDRKVKTKSAHWGNYKNSGYSKGHLLPAGDRKFSQGAYNNTFLTSNISPQKPEFNAGVWNRLEQKVRYWASKERHLYIVTGGILEDGLNTIGREKVSVPKSYYKVLLDNTQPEVKAIAFLIPHKETKRPLYEFVVSIDHLERITGIDFFPALSDVLEDKLEAGADYKRWSF